MVVRRMEGWYGCEVGGGDDVMGSYCKRGDNSRSVCVKGLKRGFSCGNVLRERMKKKVAT